MNHALQGTHPTFNYIYCKYKRQKRRLPAGRRGFEPVIRGVCVLCVSGMLRCRHCSNRFPSHLLPKSFHLSWGLDPPTSLYHLPKTESRASLIASVGGGPGLQPPEQCDVCPVRLRYAPFLDGMCIR